jgi:hypothetical protein
VIKKNPVRMPIKPKIWGKPYWKTMFYVASYYPTESPTKKEKKHYSRVYCNFLTALPCEKCRNSAKYFAKQMPLYAYLTNRKTLLMWLYLLKERVSLKIERQKGKKIYKYIPITFEQCLNKYDK